MPLLSCLPAAVLAWMVKGMAFGRATDWLWIVAAMATFGIVYAGVLLFGFKKLEFFRRIAGEFRSR